MKAMILAAGLGTRLRPLTDDRPKALVAVAGRTLLEIAILRLRAFGVTEAIVNTHHCAGMIAGYLNARSNFGIRIELSHEEELLDTGGGLKKAAHFFIEDGRNSRGAVHPAQRGCDQHHRPCAHGAVSSRTKRAGHFGCPGTGNFALLAFRRRGRALRAACRPRREGRVCAPRGCVAGSGFLRDSCCLSRYLRKDERGRCVLYYLCLFESFGKGREDRGLPCG